MAPPVSLAFLAGGMGTGELLVIFAVVLILFGPRRLPAVARSLAKALNEIRKASHEFRSQVMSLDDDETGAGQRSSPEALPDKPRVEAAGSRGGEPFVRAAQAPSEDPPSEGAS